MSALAHFQCPNCPESIDESDIMTSFVAGSPTPNISVKVECAFCGAEWSTVIPFASLQLNQDPSPVKL